MIRKIALITMLVSAIAIDSKAQYQNNFALGLKVGEPLGLNVRKYISGGDKVLDFNLGTYGFLYGGRRKYGIGANKGTYKGAGVMFQTLYSWHKSMFKGENFHIYYGFGGQVNSRNHYPTDRIGQRDDKERKISLGPTGNVGFEFELPENDLAVFVDAGAYLEALPSPFFVHPQINGGIRLNIIK